MSTSHLDRKELKRPDAFLERVNSLFKYINENSKAFLAALGLIFAIAVITALVSSMSDKKSDEANSALYVAHQALTDGLAKTMPAPKPAATEGETKKAEPVASAPKVDWDQATRAGFEKLEKVAKDYSGTQAAFEALTLLGDTYYEHKDNLKAVEYYRKAVESARNRTQKAVAQHSLAFALENSKQYDSAIDAFRQVVASGDKALKADAMMGVARNYELKEDKAKAIESYGLVSKEFPNSLMGKNAEVQAGRLK